MVDMYMLKFYLALIWMDAIISLSYNLNRNWNEKNCLNATKVPDITSEEDCLLQCTYNISCRSCYHQQSTSFCFLHWDVHLCKWSLPTFKEVIQSSETILTLFIILGLFQIQEKMYELFLSVKVIFEVVFTIYTYLKLKVLFVI